MLLASGSYPEPGGYSQGDPKPYALHFSFSSPATQHGTEVLHELASQQEAPQKKFP